MPNLRAVLFVNGQVADLEAAHNLVHPGDLLIAVDGGARHLTAMGLLPEILIGDLDSLSADEVAYYQEKGVTIQRFPVEKDETDLELAIQYAVHQGASSLLIIGALGGRVDQTLANIFLLTSPALSGLDARLDDGVEAVTIIRNRAIIHGRPGDTLSLLPLGGPTQGISTTGLRYPLHSETLYPYRSRGVSNELLANQAEITLNEGVCICVHARKKEK
jgi:thiamine pyrophosphokinase